MRDLVEEKNCIFQRIALENDIGNDAYIEFIQAESATGFCMAAQIKAGDSYIEKTEAVLRSDKDHFEYWHSHVLPIAGIVYDPARDVAYWCDITRLLELDPSRVEVGPYSIRIPKTRVLDSDSFGEFYRHFFAYKDVYTKSDHLGSALAKFADRMNVESCLDGLMALFSFHRHRFTSWYYLISSYRNFRSHPLLLRLTLLLSRIPGHMDIFWHPGNIIPEQVSQRASDLMVEVLGRDDVETMLSVVEDGFARGSTGQEVHAIVHFLPSRNRILESIVFDPAVAPRTRYWALLLLVTHSSKDAALSFIAKYIEDFGDAFEDDEDIMLDGVAGEVRETGEFYLYT